MNKHDFESLAQGEVGRASQACRPGYVLGPGTARGKAVSARLSRGPVPLAWRPMTRDPVQGSFIDLMKLPNEGTVIFLVPASNHSMFSS